MRLCSWLSLVLCLCLAGVSDAAELDVFILAGQSNAAGRSFTFETSDNPDATGTAYSDYLADDDSILYAHREMDLLDGSLLYDQPVGDLRIKPDAGLGPEMTLARDLGATTPYQTAMIKFVSGGSSIRHWQPGDALYDPFVAFLNEQKATFESLGYVVRWKGLFWAQGEADGSQSGASGYVGRFNTLTTSLREDLSTPDLPVVVAQIKSNLGPKPWYDYSLLNPHTASINTQMDALDQTDARLALTASNNDLTVRFDGIHYVGDSALELGHRLADAYASLGLPANAPGDFDHDNDIDPDDIDALFAQHGNTGSPEIDDYDLVPDGRVIATALTPDSDLDELIRNVIRTEYGDTNLDRRVSLLDLEKLGNFGQAGGWADGDFTGDGRVSLLDLNMIGTYFGFDATIPSQPVNDSGDFDRDGDTDHHDIDALFAQHGNDVTPDNEHFDLTGDGHIYTSLGTPNSDIDRLILNIVRTEYGDANLDNRVSLLDLNALKNFGQPGGWADGDFNGDGVVTLIDLSLLGSRFGFDATVVNPIPEPMSLAMLAIAGLALGRRRCAPVA